MRAGSHAEFASAIPHYEKHVAELAEQGMDMIHPGGTPPFMLQGYDGEALQIADNGKCFILPEASAREAALTGAGNILSATSLLDVCAHLCDRNPLPPAAAVGHPVRIHVEPNLLHVFALMPIPEGARARDAMVDLLLA